jgi:CRISPR-associated protein (TIGR03984 family)
MDKQKTETVYRVDLSYDLSDFERDPRSWLEKQLPEKKGWLLAYADDGVFWGEVADSKLRLAEDAFPTHAVKLTAQTLQRAYLFNETRELQVWKSDPGFQARMIEDNGSAAAENGVYAQNEKLILWGTQVVGEPAGGFAWMADGEQELYQIVPVEPSASDLDPEHLKRPLRLLVRQYIEYREDNAQAFVAASRLYGLEIER